MSQKGGDDVSHGDLGFDLVLATIGRTTEVERFLHSVADQTHTRLRVILIDQNADARLEPVVEAHTGSLAVDLTVSEPGLSRARNAALQRLAGDVVAFPDDDCTYPPDLIERVEGLLALHTEWDGIAGRTVDQSGASSFLIWPAEPTLVTRKNVWRTAVATTIFLRRHVVESVGLFDEALGAGSGTEWGSGEETDYLLRALNAGFTIAYNPEIRVVHDSPRPELFAGSSRKAYLTGMGNSRVLRKHGYSVWFAASRVLQLLGGAVYFLARGRISLARFYAAMAWGRVRGWSEG